MVGTKNARSEPAKFVASAAGSAAALLLVLTLFAITAGIGSRAVAYIKETPADIWVMRSGTSNVHMSTSVMPLTTLAEIRDVPGVDDAYYILYAPQFVSVRGEPERKFFSYVVGFEGKQTGPWKLASGRLPKEGSEIAIDEVMAGTAGLGLGDKVRLWGRRFKIVGLTSEAFSMANTLVFVPRKTMASIVSGPGVANYILVKKRASASAGAVAGKIDRDIKNVKALARAKLVANDERMIFSMSLDILYVMSAVSYLIALMVVALISYTSTVSRLREFGVLKAIGAAKRSIYRVVIEQTALPAVMGVIIGIGTAFALAAVTEPRLPEIHFQFNLSQAVFASLSLVLISIFAAAIPIRKVSRLDPIIVFRR